MKYVVVLILISFSESKLKEDCKDCIDYQLCPAALDLVRENTSYAMTKFLDAVCDFKLGQDSKLNSLKLCCSSLQEDQRYNLLPEDCGEIIEDRIFGGRVAGLFEFPWIVVFQTPNSPHGHCSGSIINSKYILTSANCVVDANVTNVRVGEYDLSTDMDCVDEPFKECREQYKNFSVEEIVTHKNYNFSRPAYNIALIRLKTAIEFIRGEIYPLCLPKPQEYHSLLGKRGFVLGWGSPDTVLLKSYIRVVNGTDCLHHEKGLNNTMCVIDIFKNTCNDAGSPLVIAKDAKYTQYSISSDYPCSQKHKIYTDVRKHMDWILSNLRE